MRVNISALKEKNASYWKQQTAWVYICTKRTQGKTSVLSAQFFKAAVHVLATSGQQKKL